MKRHNFKGQGASHGNHKNHRTPGAIGSCAFPARVFKGTRMSGHMGHATVTTLNLEVVDADVERNLLLVKGSVPGPAGGVVTVRSCGQDSGEGRLRWLRSHSRPPAGADSGTVELDDAVFGIQPNVPVMHQVVTAQLAHRRSGTQSTKTRSDVRGGGAKPYRQKGTGNARQGSTNAPHYTGGGVAFAPKPRNYRQRTPKKMVRLALRSALSDRAAEGKVLVVDSWGFDTPKTKDAVAALSALGLEGKVLVVLEPRGRRRRSQLPQRPQRAGDPRQRAQRLRRALQRLDRLHRGQPPGVEQPDVAANGAEPATAEATDESAEDE